MSVAKPTSDPGGLEQKGPALDELDQAIRKRSQATLPSEIQLVEDLILLLNRGTAIFTGMKHDRGLNMLSGILAGRAFNSLWRAREDALCGYYVECFSLARNALEDWATISWLELHPDDTDIWLWKIVDEVERPDKIPPKFEMICKELGKLGKRPAEAWDALSKFTHPRSVGLRWLIHFDPESTYFHYGGHFDEHGLRICLYFLAHVSQGFLRPVGRLQERMMGSVDEAWLVAVRDLSEKAMTFIQSVNESVLDQAQAEETPDNHRS